MKRILGAALVCALVIPAPAGAATLSMQRAKRVALGRAQRDADRKDGVVYAGPVCRRRSATIVRCGYRIQFTIYSEFGNLLGIDETHLRIGLVQGFVLAQRVAHRGWTQGLKRDEPPLPPLKP